MPSDKNQQTSDEQRAQERRKTRADGKSADKHPPRGLASIDDNRYGDVEFDAKGNAVWHWKTEEPRRREEDPTIDLLECLTSEQLALDDPDEAPPPEGFNPYDHTKKR